MQKIDADHLKTKYAQEIPDRIAFKYFSKDRYAHYLTILDIIESELRDQIGNYSLDFTHDLLDDETPQIVRVFWFSKGMRHYFICIDGNGLIRKDFPMPKELLSQTYDIVKNAINF